MRDVINHGVVLFCADYEGCVRFYRDLLELPVWYEKPTLTCFRFGDGYLMVERDGQVGQTRGIMLRFNVMNVPERARELAAKGIAIEVQTHDWGTTARFHDPDGNLCQLKDAEDPYFS